MTLLCSSYYIPVHIFLPVPKTLLTDCIFAEKNYLCTLVTTLHRQYTHINTNNSQALRNEDFSIKPLILNCFTTRYMEDCHPVVSYMHVRIDDFLL